MSSKNIFLVLGLSLILTILISSDVSARELTEDTNTEHEKEKADHTNGLEESKYPYGGGYNGGGYNGGGYNRGGGGYYGGGGYHRGGGGYNGGGGYHRGGGGYGGCFYGCCGGYGGGYYGRGGCRCCATASEAAQYKEANPQN